MSPMDGLILFNTLISQIRIGQCVGPAVVPHPAAPARRRPHALPVNPTLKETAMSPSHHGTISMEYDGSSMACIFTGWEGGPGELGL